VGLGVEVGVGVGVLVGVGVKVGVGVLVGVSVAVGVIVPSMATSDSGGWPLKAARTITAATSKVLQTTVVFTEYLLFIDSYS
jgi:hypothetical protein